MLVVISRGLIRSERRDDFVAAAQEMAMATRDDQGCRQYAFCADIEDPRWIVCVEIWDDDAALDAHMGHPHTARFLDSIADSHIGDIEMHCYTATLNQQ
ncbi:hypothetical protein GOPIP_043_00220 [Gordonia polyisoprenivorans NBRC 16320 = JCM 10675]|uniref:Antibiotic biosynthesis monooxygenase n=1 Tax=Gordonia polyisoprenivorans TaxID=84595 RepID=A0A846WSI7_9ACTN|nr:putative quinol monooxygenase [Gordonia polyisoprenivorans]MBE7193092.1 antibiotic biosynthesis monooxygenase [Gordonia polyisoprenivorans]NKY04495.1 antibiotic biosynthesis monooxygenase [Gordonia polyisoprenivorans]OZC32482.1 antibiotic biosynthesis monooxygenase [Gordonia polyisoprenivorans]UZF55893.1 antibiotic biosynthesis monooxygenase [Gordonia polyisoprenivorans]WCB37006.1 putative quinol monooxygenase [Gordonia polyisoprenivorans]